MYTLYSELSSWKRKMTNRNDQTMHAFATLRQTLKDASIEAIQQDMYEKSRRLMELMEALAPIESRASSLLGDETPPAPSPSVKGRPAKSASRKRAKYPRFYRIANTLYKEGMRQDGKSIYTQKVGRQTFETIFAAVANCKTRKFKPGDVIDQVEQPSYQVYIVLNVLQDAGLVENPERGSYQTTKKIASTDASELWNGIEEESAA